MSHSIRAPTHSVTRFSTCKTHNRCPLPANGTQSHPRCRGRRLGAGVPGSRRCSRVPMSRSPVLGGGAGGGADGGASDSKCCNNSVSIGLEGGVGTGAVGSRRRINASRLSVLAGGVVTAATIWSANTHSGLSTVYTGKALSGPAFTILWVPVSAWLSHTRQRSTMSRMGVSGGTLSRCRRKAQLSCLAKSTGPPLPFGPSSQTSVDNLPTGPVTHNVL